MRISIPALAFVLLAAVPAGAHTRPGATEVTFEGLPCAVACASWVDEGFFPCENPFPPGSYDDALTTPAPTPDPGRFVILTGTIDPELDWDVYFCESEPPYRELAQGANLDQQRCDTLGQNSAIPLGCHEDMSIPVRAGQTVIMRAYNWSDALPATGHYWFDEI